jgi:hypothetical protein
MAASTASETTFSLAMRTTFSSWRRFSDSIAAAISGSTARSSAS